MSESLLRGRGLLTIVTTLGLIAAMGTACGKKKKNETTAGQGGATGIDALSAEEYYKTVVHPEIDATCGVCHQSDEGCVPKFMDDNANGSYVALKAYTGMVTHADNSNLIYHGAHTGPALTQVQEDLVRVWLDKEFDGEETPSPTLDEALKEFGGCMSEVDFTTEELYLLAYQQTEHGPCGSCHRTGEAGTWIGYNADEMFDKNSQIPWIKRLVEPVYDENNVFVDLAASNRFVNKVEQANACGASHPGALVPVEIVNAIEQYFQATHTRWQNGACDNL